MTENEKTTALIPSVGADGGQPPHNSTKQRIPHETCESNPSEENIEEMRERIRRMNDPHYLHKDRKMKSVQIPYDLFIDLAMYHLRGKDDFKEEIRQGLEQKLDAMLNRQIYSRYKTAPTEEEREQARQEYLDRRGVPQSYRWTTPPWEL